MTVAQTILQQLGGNKFVAMTGAKDFFGGTSLTLTFSLSSRMTRNKCNRVLITLLQESDTYKVQFCKYHKLELNTITTIVGVQVAELRDIFTQETGLVTGL